MRYKFTTRDAERFWRRVNKNCPVPTHCPELGCCWTFDGPNNGNGYRTFSARKSTGTWGTEYAHRVSEEAARGPLEAGMCALHKCDNRACVRPDHLFRGTTTDNNRDMTAKGRNVMQTRPDAGRPAILRYFQENPGVHAGTRNPRSRLTEQSVPVIRARYAAGGIRLFDLAEEYGVTIQSIWAAIKRKTWTHVA